MLLYLSYILFIPIGISTFYFIIRKENHLLTKVACSYYISNVLITFLYYYVVDLSYIMHSRLSLYFFLYVIIGNVICTIVSDFIQRWLIKHNGFPIYKKITLSIGLLFTFLFTYFMWLLGSTGRMSFSLFIYNLTTPLNTNTGDFTMQVTRLLMQCFCMSISIIILLTKPLIWKKFVFKERKMKRKTVRFASILIPIILICICLYFPYYSFHFDQAYRYLYVTSDYIEKNYIDPNQVNMIWPKDKRNLIYIFVESLETSSFSKELGGLNDANLLPNLTKLMDHGTYFSHHENGFGGTASVPLATTSISGMMTALSGVNYKLPMNVGAYDEIRVIPSVTTLTDLLYEQGYAQYYTTGTLVDDYSIGNFFRAHGNAKTVGLEEKIADGSLPEDYYVWWGFEDSKLFQYAQEDLISISSKEQPFFYAISTTNTHNADGYTEPFCKTGHQYAAQDAIACEDQMLDEFLQWIMKQPFYEDTTVVIVGDHIAHEEAYTKTLPEHDRKIFNLILNGVSPKDEKQYQNRQFFAGDLFPTVLSALGVEIKGDRLGLGTNLYSGKQTLIEQIGLEEFSEYLEMYSDFYANTFLKPKSNTETSN